VTSIAVVARNFGISESCLSRWLKMADREDGITSRAIDAPPRPGESDVEAENRELRKRARQLEQENEILRRATAYFRPRRAPKMMYPLVLDLADDKIPVAVTCRVLGFSKQAFYKWPAKPVSDQRESARSCPGSSPWFAEMRMV